MSMVPMIDGVLNYNGSGTPCDMLVGPCSCGAWHKPEDWKQPLRAYAEDELREAFEAAFREGEKLAKEFRERIRPMHQIPGKER